MGLVYFISEASLVVMDSETSIDISRSNTVVSSSVMSTREVSDDLIAGMLNISVTGVVTYSKTAAQNGNPTPQEWVDLVEQAISAKARFTVYAANNSVGSALLRNYPNMVIADYGYIVDKYTDTITVRVSFKEVFVSDAATTTYLPPKQSATTKPANQTPTTGGKGTATNVTSQTALSWAADGITNLITGE